MNIEHDEQSQKFFTVIDGHKGYISYAKPDAKTLNLEHTFVDYALRNRGIATELLVHVLEFAQEHHLKIIPTCSFIRRYVGEHPEWNALVTM